MSVLCVEAGINNSCVLAAAALHDTIEHTETTPAELEAEFGSQIASIVAEMTDDKALPKAERKQLQIERASHKSREAPFVKQSAGHGDKPARELGYRVALGLL